MSALAVAEAAASGREAPLVVRDVSVSFDGLQVLHRVSIDVRPGEILGLIGPNGAGKTTLFDCVSGFVPCTGRAWVAGTEITSLAPHRRARAGLGRSFQDARLYHSLTVLDTLRVAAELHVRPAPVVMAMAGALPARRAEDAATGLALEQVDALGLAPYRDKLVGELSTGTRRIVDLACLLLQGPKVVLLDEPSSGIAQKEVEALRLVLVGLRDRTGCAIVLIEHDMPLLLGLADRVYALETGVVIAEGAPDTVVHDPEVVRSYLGTDPGAIERSSGESKSPRPRTARRPRKRR